MGYVYALQFDDLAVKVGQAVDVDRRIATHRREAARFGRSILQTWTAQVTRVSAVEGRLIEYCLSHGTARPGTREYFTGVPWDSATWDKVSHGTSETGWSVPGVGQTSAGTPNFWDNELLSQDLSQPEVGQGLSHFRDRQVSQGKIACPWRACPTNEFGIIWDSGCPSRDLCHRVREIDEAEKALRASWRD